MGGISAAFGADPPNPAFVCVDRKCRLLGPAIDARFCLPPASGYAPHAAPLPTDLPPPAEVPERADEHSESGSTSVAAGRGGAVGRRRRRRRRRRRPWMTSPLARSSACEGRQAASISSISNYCPADPRAPTCPWHRRRLGHQPRPPRRAPRWMRWAPRASLRGRTASTGSGSARAGSLSRKVRWQGLEGVGKEGSRAAHRKQQDGAHRVHHLHHPPSAAP